MLIGIIGQSNAGLELPSQWEPSGNLRIWRNGSFSPADPGGHGLGHLIGDKIARERPNEHVAVATAARGGAAILQWLDQVGAADMWSLTDRTMAAASCASGEKVSALFWFQGEADIAAGNRHYIDDFLRVWRRMDDQEWLSDNASFFIFGVSQIALKYAEQFNASLTTIESGSLRRFFIDTSTIPITGWEEDWDVPFLHLNAGGQMVAAELALEAWKLAEDIPPLENKWKAEVARLAEQVGPLMDQRQALMNHAMHLQSIIDRMHVSSSWRLTAPLRWLRRGMKI